MDDRASAGHEPNGASGRASALFSLSAGSVGAGMRGSAALLGAYLFQASPYRADGCETLYGKNGAWKKNDFRRNGLRRAPLF